MIITQKRPTKNNDTYPKWLISTERGSEKNGEREREKVRGKERGGGEKENETREIGKENINFTTAVSVPAQRKLDQIPSISLNLGEKNE